MDKFANAPEDFQEMATLLLGFFDMKDDADKVKKISHIFAAEGEHREVKVEKILDIVLSGHGSKVRPVDFVKKLGAFLKKSFEDPAEEIAKIILEKILEMRGKEVGVAKERIEKAIVAKDGDADYGIDPENLFRIILSSLLGDEEEEEKIAEMINEHDDDDVSVFVAKNGEVALRDFPHARYHCLNFRFASTPHEKHCKKCYCSVCEIPAPCRQWSGTNGHCHITK